MNLPLSLKNVHIYDTSATPQAGFIKFAWLRSMAFWAWEVAAGRVLGSLKEELWRLSQLWALQGGPRGLGRNYLFFFCILALRYCNNCFRDPSGPLESPELREPPKLLPETSQLPLPRPRLRGQDYETQIRNPRL